MDEITVIDWISFKEASKHDESISLSGGFFNWNIKGMRWNDYIKHIKQFHSPYFNDTEMTNKKIEYIEVLRKEIVNKKIRISGDEHQNNNNGTPLFSDDTVASFSFRGWGDLMAAIWSEEENYDYCYMDFYM
jgi:hypothetical protein